MLLSHNESTHAPELSLKQQAIDWLVLLRSDDIGEEEVLRIQKLFLKLKNYSMK